MHRKLIIAAFLALLCLPTASSFAEGTVGWHFEPLSDIEKVSPFVRCVEQGKNACIKRALKKGPTDEALTECVTTAMRHLAKADNNGISREEYAARRAYVEGLLSEYATLVE